MVKLKTTCTGLLTAGTAKVTGPPNASGTYFFVLSTFGLDRLFRQVYPPGPAWIYLVINGVPSKGQRVIIGTGASPPVDQGAID